MWQERRFRYLLNLLLNLPRASLFQEALSQDDELVEQMMANEEEAPSKAIRMAEFTPEVEAIYNVIDRAGDIVSAVVGSTGKKPRHIPAMKRPETAWTRVAFARRKREHDALVKRVLPNG